MPHVTQKYAAYCSAKAEASTEAVRPGACKQVLLPLATHLASMADDKMLLKVGSGSQFQQQVLLMVCRMQSA